MEFDFSDHSQLGRTTCGPSTEAQLAFLNCHLLPCPAPHGVPEWEGGGHVLMRLVAQGAWVGLAGGSLVPGGLGNDSS